jgi:hypothetical protein
MRYLYLLIILSSCHTSTYLKKGDLVVFHEGSFAEKTASESGFVSAGEFQQTRNSTGKDQTQTGKSFLSWKALPATTKAITSGISNIAQ